MRTLNLPGFILFTIILFPMPRYEADAQENRPIQAWQKEQRSDPLRGTTFLQFSLTGKFLASPRTSSATEPVLVVRCIPGKDNHGHTNGKHVAGYVFMGGVVDSTVNDSGNSVVRVEYRLDDGKLQTENWARSTDFSAIFLRNPDCPLCGSGYTVLANLLYGHSMYHKEGTTPQVRKVVIGVSEFLGGEVVMQFDLPDSNDIAEACGIIWHK